MEAADTSTPAPGKRLTEAEWAEAKGLYETGRMTKVDLSKKFGVSRQSMTEGLNKRGAVFGARSKEIEAATVEGQKTDAHKKASEIGDMREERKKAIVLLGKLQNRIIADCLSKEQPLASKQAEIKALNGLIKNAAIIRGELWSIYDLDRDPDGGEEIPEFIVSEYEPDEIAAINRQRLGEDVSAEAALAALDPEGDVAAELDELVEEAASS